MMSSEVLARHYMNVAGLSLLVYDQFLSWDREMQHIWKSDALPLIKLSFCICRYFALAGQGMNVIYSSPSFLEWKNPNCHRWLLFQMCLTYLLVCNMELIMMTRIYALYDRSAPVGGVLAIWFIFCCGFDGWNISRWMREVVMEDLCIVIKRSSGSAKWFCILTLFNQAVFWLLIYQRYRNAMQEGWSDHPVLILIMRENSWMFLALCGNYVAFFFPVRRSVKMTIWQVCCFL